MNFLHPGWFLLSLILPLILLGAILAYRSRGKAWRQMVSPRLQKQLVQQTPETRRWISLSLGLLGCALLIAVIARPYYGKTTTTEEIRTRNILITVDTSRSMLVQDGSPDRMATAKAMALEITNAFPNDRIGIIAFSGSSVLLAPLTIDHSSVKETVGQLDTEIIPSGGSNLPSAVKLAIKTFQKIGHNSNALIIISDGEDHTQAITNVADQIRNAQLAVSTVGVGSPEGGMIPDPRYPDGKYRDVRGNTVHSQMTSEALIQLANAGRGAFTQASANAPATIRDSLGFLESNQQEGRQISLPNEQFQWFLIPAICCLIASMLVRSHLFSSAKQAPLAACLLAMLFIPDAHAATDLEQAHNAYQQKDYQTALDSFEKALDHTQGEDRRAIQFSIGSAAYRLKNWEQASHYFSKSLLTTQPQLRESSHYNMGNTLFQSAWSLVKPADQADTQPSKTQTDQNQNINTAITQLEDTIGHYDATLTLNPDHKDARHNRAEAEKLLKQLKQKQQQKQDQQQGDKPQKGDGKQPQQKGDQSDQSQDPKNDGNQQGDNPDQGDQNQPPEKPDQGDGKEPQQDEQPDDANQKHEQKPGETDEAYAARILKENSDAETRPVKSRFLRIRRPAKDW